MKKFLSTFIALTVIFSAISASAATEIKDETQLAREVIQAERRLAIYRVMDLTASEKAGFWPIYDEYVAAKEKISDRILALIRKRAALMGSEISDAEAISMMNEMFSIESDLLSIEMEYAKKFQTVIPGKKVARFFQLENKLDAQRDLNLAIQIPLIGGAQQQ